MRYARHMIFTEVQKVRLKIFKKIEILYNKHKKTVLKMHVLKPKI